MILRESLPALRKKMDARRCRCWECETIRLLIERLEAVDRRRWWQRVFHR